MIEVTGQINAVRRTVGERVLEAGTARTATVGQAYVRRPHHRRLHRSRGITSGS